MSVIIRLQNLPWSANALDIRQFFHGLSIPEGGVHIVGGELGDAFIAFSTDEDARQAFNRNNGKLKEIQIKLLLSSRTEMQKVIEVARNQSMAAFMNNVPAPPPPSITPIMPSIVPSAVPEIKKDEKNDNRDKRRTRSKSRDRKDRYDRKRDRRRDRTRSKSRDRNRDRRRRDRSRSRDRTRSRDRDRKSRDNRDNRRSNDKSHQNPIICKEPRVGVWEAPPPSLLAATPAASANLLANFVANNILPNILQKNPIDNSQKDSFAGRWDSPSFNNLNDSNNGPPNNFNNDRQNYNNNLPGRLYNDLSQDQSGEHDDSFPNCCVKLEPFFGPFSEIRRFFNGLYIHTNGIKFINDGYGKRTGSVFIKFVYPEGKDEALGRNGDRIRNQLISICHITDEEYDNAVDRYYPNDQDENDDDVMIIEPFNNPGNEVEFIPPPFNRGDEVEHKQPFNKSQVEDKLKFNKSQDKVDQKSLFNNQSTCILIEFLPPYAKEIDIKRMFSDLNIVSTFFENKPRNKCAYVKFNSSADATKAFNKKEVQLFDGKPLKVSYCSDEQFENIKSEHKDDTKSTSNAAVNAVVPSKVILMTGLPLKCSDRDIIDFFSDIGVMPAKIDLKSNESGFTGEAVCEFYNNEDSILGFQKNGMPFGSSTVSMTYQTNSSSPPKPVQNQNVRIPNNLNAPRMLNNMNLNNPLHMNRPPFFAPRNSFMGPPRGPPRMPPMMGNRMGPPHMRRFPPPHQNHQNLEGPDEELAPVGCTLLMENVPYKASLDEIFQFLDGFDIPTENVLRKYNQHGLPSGETKVIFNSPNEVYQVIEEKKGVRIRDRMIYLSQI